MEETQIKISKKKQESKEKSRTTRIKNNIYLNNKHGITLIALVVTIVVMLILAGITIQTALGDGGLIDLANQSNEQQIIATYKDRIGIVGINWSLNRALDDSVTVDDLWQDMQDAGIIEDKDRDVEKLDDNGNYIITVPEGYKFQIHINEYDDVEVEYIGKDNNLLPYISAITVVSQTTNSVELQVSVSRLNNGTLNYYYKVKGESDESYQLVKDDTTDLTASITGLTDGTTYEIKVEATNENGKVEKVTEILIGELMGTITQKGETEWSNGTATIHIETQVPNVSILYQINSTEGTYLPYDDTQGITGVAHGDTVFAVLSDGTNTTDYTSINILDNLPPQQAQIVFSTTETEEGETITATVTHTDNESGVAPTNCKWIYNTNPNSIGTEENSYLNAFNSNGQTINLIAETEGTYYLHVLTIDVAGHKTETISQAVIVNSALPTIEETLVAGNHVTYVDGTGVSRDCVVLYDSSSTYGVEIITMETVESFTIGTYDFNTSMNQYNDVINILNNATSKYLNTTYVDRVRSVGSVPNNPSYDGAGMHYTQFGGNYSGKLKNTDSNYLTDWNRMETLGIQYINNSSYWLASRFVFSQPYTSNFRVRDSSNVNNETGFYFIVIDMNTSPWSTVFSHGLRPVFHLKQGIKVTGGNGTSNSPYTLGT